MEKINEKKCKFCKRIIVGKSKLGICSDCVNKAGKSILIIQNSTAVRTKVFVHLFHPFNLRILILYFFLKLPFFLKNCTSD